MSYLFPQGTLSITEATGRLIRLKNYKWTRREAWRAICEAIRKRNLPAYVMYGGRSLEADRAQFAAPGDQDPLVDIRQFASTTLESCDLPGRMAKRLLPVWTSPLSGPLFFCESDFDEAFPRKNSRTLMVDQVAAWLSQRYRSRPALKRDELLRIISNEGGLHVSMTVLDRALRKAWR
jgi:hypothetical protein